MVVNRRFSTESYRMQHRSSINRIKYQHGALRLAVRKAHVQLEAVSLLLQTTLASCSHKCATVDEKRYNFVPSAEQWQCFVARRELSAWREVMTVYAARFIAMTSVTCVLHTGQPLCSIEYSTIMLLFFLYSGPRLLEKIISSRGVYVH